MTIKSNSMKGTVYFVLLGLLLSIVAAGAADAFYFSGHTYDVAKTPLNNTNVTIEEYNFTMGGPPQIVATYYGTSNATGYFNVSGMADNISDNYKITIKHFNDGGFLDYIGQSLPAFPYFEISHLTSSGPVDFYLRPGGTINITAINESGIDQSFRYQVKDTKLGYPIAENWNDEVTSATIYVPAERNYSIMIYPNQSFPVSYDLSGLIDDPNHYASIRFDTSNLLRRVTGYAKFGDSADFDDLRIIAYLMEPGNMVFQDYPLPYNMSAWACPTGPGSCSSDTYNPVTGEYNITLPGAAMNANILMFVTARNASGYYGAFRNISLDYSNISVTNFNFSLQQLLGTAANISIDNAKGPDNFMEPDRINITTKKLAFQLKNQTSGANLNGAAFVEVHVNYTGTSFKWTVNVDQSNDGLFTVPAINADISRINIFTQNSAPLKTSKTASQLASPPVVINMTSFNPGAIDESEEIPDIMMDMLKSNTECDVPNPAAGCSLMPNPDGLNMSDFNPLKIVISGGKISMRIKKASNNITVHYKNVDLLASGPPDAIFDSSGTTSNSSLEEAFRFGSKGPEIYDSVLIGMPYNSSMFGDDYTFKMRIEKLYNESWGAVWETSDGIASIPSDYSAYTREPYVGYMGSTGLSCSKTDQTATCYVDTTAHMIWMQIPHFSGVGPTVVGTAPTTPPRGGSSGGSTGSNGVTTTEPVSNIEKAERFDKDLPANTPVTYSFSAAEHGISQVVITGKENENAITVRIEALKGTSNNAKTGAPGTIYKNMNIIVGTKKIKEAIIKFKVENSWLDKNKPAGSEIRLVKWDGSKWIQRETAEKSKDGAFTHFEAKTDSFSSFAIVAMKASEAQAVPGQTDANVTATVAGKVETTNAPLTTPKETPGFEPILAVFALCAVYLLGKKRR